MTRKPPPIKSVDKRAMRQRARQTVRPGFK
jgi:hypothetical protein